MQDALDASLRYLRAGFSVIPVKADGTKRPALAEWERFHSVRADEAAVRSWHAGLAGVGIVTDAASGNLGVFDFEFADFYDRWCLLVEEQLPGLLARLPVVKTPGKDADGGRHVYARLPEVYAGRKLARVSKEEAARRTGDPGKTTAIELKGRGGQVLAPGCPASCHPSGRTYDPLAGPAIEQTPTLAADEVKVLVRAALSLGQSGAKAKPAAPAEPRREEAAGGEKPGEDFNARQPWAGILEPHGWAVDSTRGPVCYWTRPGKEKGISASTGHCTGKVGGDLLYVFSTNADPLEAERTYSKFGAYAELNFGGDHSKAAKELARIGFGSEQEVIDPGEPEVEAAVGEPEPERKETPPWPVGVFPRQVEEYIAVLAKSLACPPDLPGAAVLTVAGAAIGASRALAVTRKWLESPRLFVALVADPGGGKSPAVDQVTEPLVEAQSTAHALWAARKTEYDLELEVYEQQKKVYAKRIAEARNDDEREKAGAKPCPPERPSYPHCYTTEFTTEALIPMLVENPKGFLGIKDELSGWIAGMNQYKAGGKGSDRQFWLSAWSGATIKVDRKSGRDQGPLVARRPFMSVLGGIQPDLLSSLSDERGREDGFVHRLLFVYPDDMPWSETISDSPAEGLEATWRAVVEYLFDLPMAEDESGAPAGPFVVGMTEAGREVAAGWYAAHARERSADDFPAHLVGPWSKMRAHYFRIALTVHLLRAACGEAADASDVDEDSLLRAAQLVDYFKGQLRKVYARLGCTKEDKQASRLVEWIRRRGGRATPRDLIRGHFAKKKTEAEKLLEELVDRQLGYLEKPDPSAKPKRGREAKFSFRLHGTGPKIHHPEDDPDGELCRVPVA
jgi:PHD/YefM family antitoxin component YafN of YafNO toxin-antitoxin module